MLDEVLVGGESRFTAVTAPGNASSLSSLGMVCDCIKLFYPAPCTGNFFFDLLNVS